MQNRVSRLHQIKKGFTLLETILVISILSASLLLGTTMIIISLNATIKNKNRFIATYLTQECLELARNMRDSAWKQNLPWDCGIPEKDQTANIEGKEIAETPICLNNTNNIITAENVGVSINISTTPEDFLLWYNEDTGFTHDASNAQQTIFSRKLTTIEKEADTDRAKIACTTTWTYKNKLEEIEMFEILTNWKK